MLRTILISAAVTAMSLGAANAQFLLSSDASDHKLVVNDWAGETTAQFSSADRRAASALNMPATRSADTEVGHVNALTIGAPLGSDANDHKTVVGQ